MNPNFNSAASQVLRKCLQADGTLALYQPLGFDEESEAEEQAVTWHEILAHLQENGAYELARATREPGRVLAGLLALGIPVNKPDVQGETALHHVLNFFWTRPTQHFLNAAFVTELLDAGADPDARDKSGQTPLQIAMALNWVTIVRALRRAGAICASDRTFERAPITEPESSRDAVQLFLALGGDLEAPPGGPTPEISDDDYWLYRKQDTRAIQIEQDSRTAWLEAAKTGDLPLLAALREAGANTGALFRPEYAFQSSVGLAAKRPHLEAVRQLLEWGVPSCLVHENVESALNCCIESYELRFQMALRPHPPETAVRDCAQLLLKAGERPSARTLTKACCDLELLEILWPFAPALTAKEASEILGSVCFAQRGDRARFARLLLERGADPDSDHNRPVRGALHRGDTELLALLLAAGAELIEEY